MNPNKIKYPTFYPPLLQVPQLLRGTEHHPQRSLALSRMHILRQLQSPGSGGCQRREQRSQMGPGDQDESGHRRKDLLAHHVQAMSQVTYGRAREAGVRGLVETLNQLGRIQVN